MLHLMKIGRPIRRVIRRAKFTSIARYTCLTRVRISSATITPRCMMIRYSMQFRLATISGVRRGTTSSSTHMKQRAVSEKSS